MNEDDLVHFVIEAVERLPLEVFTVNHRGSGHAQKSPAYDAGLVDLLLQQWDI